MTGKALEAAKSRPVRKVRMRVWADSVVRLDERVRARRARARAGTALEDEKVCESHRASGEASRERLGVVGSHRAQRHLRAGATRILRDPNGDSLRRAPVALAAAAARGGARVDDAPGEAGRPPGGLRRGAQVSRRNLPERKLRQPNVARRVCVCVCVPRATRGHTFVDGNVAEIGSLRRFRSVSETPGAPVRGVGPSRIRERRGSDQRRPVLERPRLDRARARFVFRVCRPAVGSFAAVHADGSARGTPRRRTLADHGRRRERARVAVPRIFVTRRRDQMRIQQRARGGTHDEARAVPRGELGLVVVRVPARAQAHSLQHVADACGFSRVPVVETEGETSR